MSMELAQSVANMAASRGQTYRFAWKSKQSKQPDQLRFGAGGQRSYMRDGILTTTNGHSGTYRRLKEFAGQDGDEQEVEIRIACDVFDGQKKLEPVAA